MIPNVIVESPWEHYIYDWEVYPNFACVTITRDSDGATWYFEISQWRNDGLQLYIHLCQVAQSKGRQVGYNNEMYDYSITHVVFENQGYVNNTILYAKSQAIFRDRDDHEKKWTHCVSPWNRAIPQVDLFKIHHFDNKAKMTSLKALEFAMMMDDIQELPFDPNVPLTFVQARKVATYNHHDVKATRMFFHYSWKAIEFRDELSAKYDKDFTNHNDTRIGVDITKIELEKQGVTVSKYNQTHRDRIVVNDIIFPYISFERPEFNAVLNFFRQSVIDPEKIKGFFKTSSDEEETKFTSAEVNGFTFDFGAGGIHGSVHKEIIVPQQGYKLIDSDVASYYPNIGIQNQLYPAHLGLGWCKAMDFMFHERLRVGKKTAMGNAYKLGLNGAYGKSNDKHSPFLDPQYTMSITINGQLMLCMLAEKLMKIPGMRMIQVNTDGLTYLCPDEFVQYAMEVSVWWEQLTKLELEHALYDKMCIRDVNSYIAVKSPFKIKGSDIVPDEGAVGVKRIGAYAYVRASEDDATRELPWHKNHSAVVVPKAAEAFLVHGKPIGQFIMEHITENPWDFYLRAKVPRSSTLYHGEEKVPNISRYYVSNSGEPLIKVMDPTPKQIANWQITPHWYHVDSGKHKQSTKQPSRKWVQGLPPTPEPPLRNIGIQSGWNTTVVNTLPGGEPILDDINFMFYIEQAEKLVKELV